MQREHDVHRVVEQEAVLQHEGEQRREDKVLPEGALARLGKVQSRLGENEAALRYSVRQTPFKLSISFSASHRTGDFESHQDHQRQRPEKLHPEGDTEAPLTHLLIPLELAHGLQVRPMAKSQASKREGIRTFG